MALLTKYRYFVFHVIIWIQTISKLLSHWYFFYQPIPPLPVYTEMDFFETHIFENSLSKKTRLHEAIF